MADELRAWGSDSCRGRMYAYRWEFAIKVADQESTKLGGMLGLAQVTLAAWSNVAREVILTTCISVLLEILSLSLELPQSLPGRH